jgi:hypothetical protein
MSRTIFIKLQCIQKRGGSQKDGLPIGMAHGQCWRASPKNVIYLSLLQLELTIYPEGLGYL